MCGIVGYIGTKREAYPILIKGLQRLEYRGYDSAGVALINKGNELNVYKTKGKVADLEEYCSGCTRPRIQFFKHSGCAKISLSIK